MLTSLRRLVWTIPVCLAATASVAGAFVRLAPEKDGAVDLIATRAERAPRADVQQALSRGTAWREFQGRYGQWRALWNEATSTPHRAFGRAIPLPGFRDDAAGADRAAREFIAQNPPLFGGVPQLEPAGAVRAGNVWYVHYRQLVAGVPVLNADWEFRIGANGNLMAFGADNYSAPTRLVTAPRIALGVAREAARAGLRFNPVTDRVGGDRLYVLPIDGERGASYRLVYELTVVTRDPRGSWYTLVDAATGDVVLRRSTFRHAIAGTITATVHPTLPSDAVVAKPLRSVYVNAGGSTVTTDTLGNYSLSAIGSVTVTSAMRGRFCNVDRCQYDSNLLTDVCPSGDASFARNATDPSTVNVAWVSTNSQQAERDAYYHVNLAHDWVKSLDPAYTASDYELSTDVNLSDNCNAFWDLSTNSLSFLSAGLGCPNTATMPDIVYHEYAHSVTDNLYLSQGRPQGMVNGALHEGLADAFVAYMTGDPVLGDGFFGAGTSLRTCANTRKWPLDRNTVEPEVTGEILSGALWDLRQSIGAATAAHVMHFAKYGLADDLNDGTAFGEYFIDLLVADDNDANLSNGTPHSAQIASTFNAHGIGTNYFINVAVTADDQVNVGPFPVTAVISYNGAFGALDVTSPTLFYSLNGAPFTSSPMFPTGNPDEYGATVPARVSAVVHYYVRAATTDGGIHTEPAGAPGRSYSFIGGLFAGMYQNDFDNDLGWTVGVPSDSATTGIWVRAVPVKSAIQPGQDHTPGGTMCYVTGNAPDTLAGPFVNDVDGGRTTLTSATFDATAGGMIRPVISYWRWFTNNAGDNPGQDPWRVDISNNGGATWTSVENTLESDQSWRRVVFSISDYVTPTSNMKIRFVASDDIAFPSLVEAAVDDFSLYGYPASVAVGDAPRRAPFALAPASPNPFHGSTQFSYTLAERGRAELSVFDLQGRVVRALVASDQEPGRHTVQWDGRDAAGRPVAAGPYFARLTQRGQRTSEAVVVIR